MSDTVTSTPGSVIVAANTAVGLPVMSAPQARAVNVAIKAAQDGPELVKGLEAVAPVLAERLTTEVASIHAAPWGGAAVALVAYAVSYLGLGWSQDFDAIVVAAGYMAGSYAVPYLVKLMKKV